MTISKHLDDFLPKIPTGSKNPIVCSQSPCIAYYISQQAQDKRIWLLARDGEMLKDLAYDISQYGKKCAIIKSLEDIKCVLDEQFSTILCSYSQLDEQFPLIDKGDIEYFEIIKNTELNTQKLREFLDKIGYFPTTCVQNEGEYCIRGEVIDIFALNAKRAVRIYLDFDNVENIKEFDTESQLAEKESDEYQKIRLFKAPDPESLKTVELRHYISSFKTILCQYDDSVQRLKDTLSPLLCFSDYSQSTNNPVVIRSSAAEFFKGDAEIFTIRLDTLISNGSRIVFALDNEVQRERLKALFFSSPDGYAEHLDKNIFIIEGHISHGFYIEDELAVFTYAEVFLKKKTRCDGNFKRLETAAIDSFMMLKEGELVVHADYGIGKFISLERIEIQGKTRDYIKIEFADEEYYYVPLERANLVQKYIGSENAPLSSLHSSAWKRKKARAAENARVFAQKLLELYALRQTKTAFCFSEDTLWDVKFASGFEYQETDDQLKAIEDVKTDMQNPKPMDRIICGDVGFGKTEVAFRAAFKAIMNSKQVCFLAPTTILANQHYNNFLARASQFPINIAQLSRMQSAKKCRECIQGLESGDIDIVFATHKILKNPVHFKNLGLLIIDEEQRFGVSDKEKIKSIKANIDTLTLTATPIPRTLYMSMINLRGLSLLKTPPALRLSVKIIVGTFNYEKIKKAIEFELSRGGQVYYLHNRTEDLEMVKSYIQTTFPTARVDAVSGQMRADKIEESIYDFSTGCTDILVCTTIIENGIDVPNANTLIVDDATIYGTSQLYQIKGRVGRGKNQAYAYLMIPREKENIEEAKKRIKVIAENSTLGSGFNISLKDLMLRGSGNILGKEQSGYAQEIGLDMYMAMLGKCIRELELERENKLLSGGTKSLDEDDEVLIKINYTAYIPDDYIDSTEMKFDIYKKIASAQREDELKKIIENVKNRFGNPPEVFTNLYTLSLLKIAMKKSGIAEFTENGDVINARIEHLKLLNIDKALKLIQDSKGDVSLNPQKPNYLIFNMAKIDESKKLQYLCKCAKALCD